jgi:hypothetical protein
MSRSTRTAPEKRLVPVLAALFDLYLKRGGAAPTAPAAEVPMTEHFFTLESGLNRRVLRLG